MKILSFRTAAADSYGIVDGDGIVDLGPLLGARYPSLRAVLAAGALSEVAETVQGRSPDLRLDEITFLPPITDPDMILCVGMNYKSAFEEIGAEFPGYPSFFMRRSAAQVAHLQPIRKPAVSDLFDCEAEIAVIVGKQGHAVPAARAMDHVAGYSIFNDASVIEWMRHTRQNVTPGKNFDASGAFGPWMVTADEIPDPAELRIIHRINGEVIQDSTASEMHFTIPQLIEYVTTFTTILPGDVISTGSPGGIRSRREAGIYVRPGDVIEMEVPGIGTLRNPVE